MNATVCKNIITGSGDKSILSLPGFNACHGKALVWEKIMTRARNQFRIDVNCWRPRIWDLILASAPSGLFFALTIQCGSLLSRSAALSFISVKKHTPEFFTN